MRYDVSEFVEYELEQIMNYIGQHNPDRAFSFVRELELKFAEIASNPFGYQLRPDYGQDARIAVHGRYIILFRIVDNIATIEHVTSGYRELSRLI